jgi:hypothetical protein
MEDKRRGAADPDPNGAMPGWTDDGAADHRPMHNRPMHHGPMHHGPMHDGSAMKLRSSADRPAWPWTAPRNGVRRRTFVAAPAATTTAASATCSRLCQGQCRGREHQGRGNR